MHKQTGILLQVLSVHALIGSITVLLPSYTWSTNTIYSAIKLIMSCEEIEGILCVFIAYTGWMVFAASLLMFPLFLFYKKIGANNRVKILFSSNCLYWFMYLNVTFMGGAIESMHINFNVFLISLFTFIFTGFFKLFAWKK